MRPLPTNTTHGIIHTVTASKEDLDKVADTLGIKGKDRDRLHSGQIHIVREATPDELKKG